MIIDQYYLLFSLKLPFSTKIYLKTCQQSHLNMPYLPYAEIFSGYEIWVRTLQQQQKCIHSLKIVNCIKDYKCQSFVNVFFKNVQDYQIRP